MPGCMSTARAIRRTRPWRFPISCLVRPACECLGWCPLTGLHSNCECMAKRPCTCLHSAFQAMLRCNQSGGALLCRQQGCARPCVWRAWSQPGRRMSCRWCGQASTRNGGVKAAMENSDVWRAFPYL
ncbi:unnamed protein product [Effrenium voratum]|nr:unnamed protein product [Effrenium voratum]